MSASNPFGIFDNNELRKLAENAKKAALDSPDPTVNDVAALVPGLNLSSFVVMPWADFMAQLTDKCHRRGIVNTDEATERAMYPKVAEVDFSQRD